MRAAAVTLVVLSILLGASLPAGAGGEDAGVRILEVVADAQHDWNQDGRVTTSDEWVEIQNAGAGAVDVTGWRLVLEDTTPDEAVLAGVVPAGGRLVVLNPPGALNNDAVVRLVDADGVERDAVAYGSFDATGEVPSADAQGPLDEALALVDGAWDRQHATPATENAGPWVEASVSLPGPTPWHVAPNASFDVTVVARHAHVALETLRVNGIPVVGNASDGHEARGSWRATTPDQGQHAVSMLVEGGGATWTWPVGVLHVDTTAPPVPVPHVPPATNTTGLEAAWTPVEDPGVGGVTYNARLGVSSDGTTRWTNVTDLAVPRVWVGTLAHDEVVLLAVRAVDGAGNASPWSAWNQTRVDLVAPAAPAGVTVTGSEQTLVQWSASPDDGAGTAAYHVLRRHDGTTVAFDVGNVTSWSDPASPESPPIEYGVAAIDAAGNTSPVTWTTAEHEALRPHVVGVRVKKPVWTSGIQELRIDFDRAMDTTTDPTVTAAGERPPGSWFANRTTYFIRLASADAYDQGRVEVTVAQATSDGGLDMSRPFATGFVVDTEPPTVTFMEEERDFDVRDAVDPGPRLFVMVWLEEDPVPPGFVLWQAEKDPLGDLEPGSWRLRYYAQDAAGLRSREAEAVLVVAPNVGASPTKDSPSVAPPEVAEPSQPARSVPAPAADEPTGGIDGVLAQRDDLAPEDKKKPVWPWALLAGGLSSGGAAMALRHRLGHRTGSAPTPSSLADRLRALRSGSVRSETRPEPGRSQGPTGRRDS